MLSFRSLSVFGDFPNKDNGLDLATEWCTESILGGEIGGRFQFRSWSDVTAPVVVPLWHKRRHEEQTRDRILPTMTASSPLVHCWRTLDLNAREWNWDTCNLIKIEWNGNFSFVNDEERVCLFCSKFSLNSLFGAKRQLDFEELVSKCHDHFFRFDKFTYSFEFHGPSSVANLESVLTLWDPKRIEPMSVFDVVCMEWDTYKTCTLLRGAFNKICFRYTDDDDDRLKRTPMLFPHLYSCTMANTIEVARGQLLFWDPLLEVLCSEKLLPFFCELRLLPSGEWGRHFSLSPFDGKSYVLGFHGWEKFESIEEESDQLEDRMKMEIAASEKWTIRKYAIDWKASQVLQTVYMTGLHEIRDACHGSSIYHQENHQFTQAKFRQVLNVWSRILLFWITLRKLDRRVAIARSFFPREIFAIIEEHVDLSHWNRPTYNGMGDIFKLNVTAKRVKRMGQTCDTFYSNVDFETESNLKRLKRK